MTKNMNISISMTSDPEARRMAPAGATAAVDEVEVVKANTVGGELKKVLKATQPQSGSPLVDLVDTDSDDCEVERRKEEAAVVKFPQLILPHI